MDWEEEIWDKIWICGIFWGIWRGDLWGGGKLGGILKNLLVEGKIGDLCLICLVEVGVGWIEVGVVWLGFVCIGLIKGRILGN